MSAEKKQLLAALADAVVEMEEEKTAELAKEYVAKGFDAYEGIGKGLSVGMERAGQLFEEEEYFIPELLLCSDAMYAGVDVLKPHIKKEATDVQHGVVLGVIEGDTHDIGKNLVKIMLESAGYNVVDLGRDVPPEKFIAKAQEIGAKIIAASTLMTTTMEGLNEIVRQLDEANIRQEYKFLIGGAPISQSFADKIGADAYADNAAEAVRLANQLVGGAA